MLSAKSTRRLLSQASSLAIAAAMLSSPTGASAASCAWLGGTGLWTTGAQWSCGPAVPGSGDTVTINPAGSVVQLVGTTQASGQLTLGGGNQLTLNNSFLNQYGDVTNNGTITLANSSRLTSQVASLTYSGTGSIVLDDSTSYAQIYGGSTITFGSGQTVRGSGQVGINSIFIVNNGVISADVATRSIDLDPGGGNGGASGSGVGTGGNASLYNTGTLQANGGTLTLQGGLYENSAAGVVQAINNGTVAFGNDVRIVNGALTNNTGGSLSAVGGTQYLQNVTLTSGSTLSLNNDFINVNTGLTNNGSIILANSARLISETAAVSYTGTGTITLDDSTSYAQIYGGTISFGSGQTVHGSGQIGANQAVITNNNLISADVTGRTIDLDASGGNGGVGAGNGVGTNGNAGLLNNKTLQATNGGTLTLEGGLYENSAAGVIQATNNGTVSFANDVRILNGTLTNNTGGSLSAVGGSQYLQNVTLSSGSVLSLNNDFIYLNTTLANNGTINVANSARLNSETATVSFTGTGTIVLDDTTSYAQIYGGTMTFGSGQTIHGSGQIGANQTVIVNNGLISADVVGRGIDLDASGGNGGVGAGNGVGAGGIAGLYNTGTLQAKGGTLTFEGGLYENSATGVIKAINGGTIVLAGDSRIVSGPISSDATSTITATGASQYLQNVTLTSGSRLNLNNDFLYLNTALTNNGTITVANSSRLTNETGGALSIGGTGTIVLDDSTSYAQIYNGTITFGSGQTVRGSGQIGLNGTLIVNNGLISADVAGRNIDVDAAGGNGGLGAGNGLGSTTGAGLLNNATMQATNGATMTFQGGLYDNTPGVIKAINGSTIILAGDSRILGGVLSSDATSQITAFNASQYLQSVTLATGSNLVMNNDYVYLNTAITNNGTISIANSSRLNNETGGALAINGTGTIVLDDSTSYAQIYNGTITFGSGQTVRGSGQIGLNGTLIVNNGLISGDVNGRNLDIDGAGGSGGTGAGGVGTGGNSSIFNTGAIQATAGGTVTFESGLYENSATGQLKASTGSTLTFGNDANLYNLQASGVLNKGVYTSSTTGAQSTLDLRSNAANSIVTLGTGGSGGTDTVVTLSGANSVLDVIPFGGGVATTIDSSLTTVDKTGELQLLNGRNFTVVAGGGAFSNAGIVQLGGGAFGAASYTNSGTTFGNGAITVAIANTGTVNATGGTLTTQAITGSTGTISTAATGTLSLGGNSTAGFLTNNGNLALNGNNVTVTGDYQNANFGAGNAFSGHAHVSGAGQILAVSATMTLSGPALTGGTLNVGNVRIGGSSSTTLTVTNNGTATTLRGAVQNTNAPSVALANADFVLNPNGGASTTTISYTGSTAGSLAGQSLNVVNNFDNVASKTINLAGNVYQIAVAASQPASVTLAAQRVGVAGASSTVSIGNVAPNTVGFTESLSSTASVGGPFAVNGGSTATTANLAAGTSQNVTLSLGNGAAGAFTGTVSISNTSIPVAGSGFAPLALAGQSITVNGKVYAAAVANVSSGTVNFGTVRQGANGVVGAVMITNGAIGALTDSLNTTVGATPSNITSTGAPGALAQNQSGNATFALNTTNAGVVSGNTNLGFTSTDADLSPLALASQSVAFAGTVTQAAKANLLLTGGAGTFSGSGTSYALNLGSFAAGNGSVSSDLAVLNNILASSFSEQLGGSFSGGTTGGFTFGGAAFSGLDGGQQTANDLLNFDYSGLGAGVYTDIITLNAYTHFGGLTDLSLSPITLTVTADITGGGGVGGVPEPSTWMELALGFGVLGAVLRRRRSQLSKAAAAI